MSQADSSEGGVASEAEGSSPCLVRIPVDKPQPAVAFLHARSEGVMDLIAHFWERLAQTPPLQRGDLHLVVALRGDVASMGADINIQTLDVANLSGAMLYVPKAHRADVLATDAGAARAFASYIVQKGGGGVSGGAGSTGGAGGASGMGVGGGGGGGVGGGAGGAGVGGAGAVSAATVGVGAGNGGAMGGGSGWAALGGVGEHKGLSIKDLSGVKGGDSGVEGGGGGKVAIDFLTGGAEGLSWMVPQLLPHVGRKQPARQLVNVVMQLSAGVEAEADSAVRVARDPDQPVLNRWRRQYKEERGLAFDADIDAMVDAERVFVYEYEGQVVAVAKFDLELASMVEIGGVYTFPEFRKMGFGAKIVGDLAARIRAKGKTPVLQVDHVNDPALRLYTAAGWHAMGRLARVWLTG